MKLSERGLAFIAGHEGFVTQADDGGLIKADASSAAFTITLPSAAAVGDLFAVCVQKTDRTANAVTVATDGTDFIDGYYTLVLDEWNQTVEIMSDGAAWRVRTAPVRRYAHPMDGQQWAGLGDGLQHHYMFGITYDDANGIGHCIVGQSRGHAGNDGGSGSIQSILVAYQTEDRFQSFNKATTICAEEDFDVADAAAVVMQSNRTGVLARLRDNDTGTYRNDFIYTDDNSNWTRVEGVLTGTSELFPYGDMVDTGTHYVVGGYRGNVQTKIAYTTYASNGAAWTSYTLFAGQGYVEPSIVKLPGEQKYIMFLRKGGGNLHISTSTDPTSAVSWSAPNDTGIGLESNPVYALIDKGRLYVYLMIRDIDEVLENQNELLMIVDDPTYVYDNEDFQSDTWTKVADLPDRTLGYFRSARAGQDWLWSFVGGENDTSTNNASSATVYFGSTRRVPLASPHYVRSQTSRPNLLHNGTLQHWTRGTSFSSVTTDTKICDRFYVRPSGATLGVDRVAVSDEVSAIVPFRPRYGCQIQTSVDDDFVGVFQDVIDETDVRRQVDQIVTIQVWGYGDLPGGPYVSASVNYGSGGSTTASNSVNLNIVEEAGAVWYAYGTVHVPRIIGRTVGTSPYIRYLFGCAANGAWDAVLLGLKVERGQTPSRFEGADFQAERALLNRYVQAVDYNAFATLGSGLCVNSTTHWSHMQFPPMRAVPTITFASGAATDLEVYDRGGGNAVSAMTFIAPSKTGVNLRATTTGLTAGEAALLRVESGAAVSFLLDTE